MSCDIIFDIENLHLQGFIFNFKIYTQLTHNNYIDIDEIYYILNNDSIIIKQCFHN